MLCLTENTPLLPPFRFHDVDSQRPKCRLGDVFLPALFYLARVPESISVCTGDDSLNKLREKSRNLIRAMWLVTLGLMSMYSVELTSIRLFAKSSSPSHRSPSQRLLVVPPLVLPDLLHVIVGRDLLEKGNGRWLLSQRSQQKKVAIHMILSSPHLNLKCS